MEIKDFQKKAGITISRKFEVLEKKTRSNDCLVVKRPDGLVVFLDTKDDPVINHIRLHADKKDVIMAVGLYRGMQIAQNYKEKYADGLRIDYMKFLDKILENVSKIKLIGGHE